MQNTAKIAVNLPRGDLEKVEKLRRRLKLGRSAVVHRAIRFWLDSMEQEKKIKKYEEGYKKKPENLSGLKALEKAAIETFGPGEKWT